MLLTKILSAEEKTRLYVWSIEKYYAQGKLELIPELIKTLVFSVGNNSIPLSHALHGAYYFFIGKYKLAQEHYEDYLRENPKTLETTLINKALQCLLLCEQYKKIIVFCEKLHKKNPTLFDEQTHKLYARARISQSK